MDLAVAPTAIELAPYIEDTKSLANRYSHIYGAVIMLDLRKRKINRSNPCFFSVSGDNLQHAIKEFMATDESTGLYNDDFSTDILTILYQSTF